MKQLLVTIFTDPRHSRLPAEAVRVAAGIGAWKKACVSLYLHGPAILCLDEFAEEYPEGILYTQYLSAIGTHGGSIYLQAGSPYLREITTIHKFEELDATELARALKNFPLSYRV